MELEVLKEIENKLFNRKEIEATVFSQITPSHEEIGKLLSEKFKVNIENIKIKRIQGKFGSKTFKVLANIYISKEEKDSVEIKKKREIEKEKRLVEEKKLREETKE